LIVLAFGHQQFRLLRRMRARMGNRLRHVGIGADADRVRPGRLGHSGGGLGVLDRNAAIQIEFGRIDLTPDREIRPDGGADRAQDLDQETRTILHRPAIFVGPLVGDRRQERGQQIAVAAMDLDRVDAGAFRPQGGGGEHIDHTTDAGGVEQLIADFADHRVAGGKRRQLVGQEITARSPRLGSGNDGVANGRPAARSPPDWVPL